METEFNKPILAYGTFGLHIVSHCSGQGYHFVGTIPVELDKVHGKDPGELIYELFKWLDHCSIADKKELVPLLRNDVFVEYLNRN